MTIDSKPSSISEFHWPYYLRHNEKRLAHLASLNLPLENRTVLEIAAGIGDHTPFFLARGCSVTITEGRADNLEVLRDRYPENRIVQLDMDRPKWDTEELFDIVYCYGALNHFSKPDKAIEFMSCHCRDLLLVESLVSFGDGEEISLCEELDNPTQSLYQIGCRPTRKWIYAQLQKYFEFVYLPITQPDHEQFPTDWTKPPKSSLTKNRAVFVASRAPIDNPLLSPKLENHQTRFSIET
jgi:hypothetical protein